MSPVSKSRLLAAGTVIAAFAAASPASAAVQGEQVNRGTGADGFGALAGAASTPRFITDDGRLSYFDHDVRGAARLSQTAGERASSGAYVRDIVANTTVQLASGNVHTTGITGDGATLSLVTDERLTAADANSVSDLYTVNLATRAITLVPASGAAVTSGAITADGKAYVWSDASGTYRRLVSGGATTKLSAAAVPLPLVGLLNRRSISADGQVASLLAPGTGVNMIARAGKTPIPVDPSGGARTLWTLAGIAPDGLTAAVSDETSLRTIAITTGAARRVPGTQRAGAEVVSVGATTAVVAGDGPTVVRFATGGRAPLAAPLAYGNRQTTPYVVSGSSRYALSGRSAAGFDGTGALPVLAAQTLGAATLPGTREPASPLTYVTFSPGCVKGGSSPAQRPSLAVNLPAAADLGRPAAVSVQVNFYNRTTFKLIKSATITESSTFPFVTELPIGWTGNWFLDVAVIPAEGSIRTERWNQGTYTSRSCDDFGAPITAQH